MHRTCYSCVIFSNIIAGRVMSIPFRFDVTNGYSCLEAPSIIERYKLAKEAGFKAVESGFPFGISIKDISEAKKNACVEQILINVFTGIVLLL